MTPSASPFSPTPLRNSSRWQLEQRRLYLCTPDRPDLETFVHACIDGGVDVVQLRDKSLSDDELVERASRLVQVCAARGVPLIVNDRPDLAAQTSAAGVHVGQEDMPAAEARRLVGADALVGLSTHSVGELEVVLGAGPEAASIDYVSAGPVVPTPTKPGRPGTGVGYVREAVRLSPWPVWVTGGVAPASIPDLIVVGARHFVVVRWLTEASDPRVNARQLREAIDDAISGIAEGDDPG